MPVGTAARRYAQAIFDLARDRGTLDAWRDDLRVAAAVLAEPRVRTALDAPQVPQSEKEQFLRASLGELDPLLQNLFLLLLRRRRIDRVSEIVAEYERLIDDAQGILRAQLTTAVTLDDAEVERLTASLRESLGRGVRLSRDVNALLIGGAILRIGDKLLDGSVGTRLHMMRRSLAQAAV